MNECISLECLGITNTHWLTGSTSKVSLECAQKILEAALGTSQNNLTATGGQTVTACLEIKVSAGLTS